MGANHISIQKYMNYIIYIEVNSESSSGTIFSSGCKRQIASVHHLFAGKFHARVPSEPPSGLRLGLSGWLGFKPTGDAGSLKLTSHRYVIA